MRLGPFLSGSIERNALSLHVGPLSMGESHTKCEFLLISHELPHHGLKLRRCKAFPIIAQKATVFAPQYEGWTSVAPGIFRLLERMLLAAFLTASFSVCGNFSCVGRRMGDGDNFCIVVRGRTRLRSHIRLSPPRSGFHRVLSRRFLY